MITLRLILASIMMLSFAGCFDKKDKKLSHIDEKYVAAVVKDELSLPGNVFAMDLKGGYSGAQLFAVTSESKKYVARFISHKSQKGRDLEIHNLKIASDAGYGPQVYFSDTSRGIVIMEYLSGKKVLQEDLLLDQFYVELANLLRKIHQGPAFENSDFNVFNRINIGIQKNKAKYSDYVPLTKIEQVFTTVHQALLPHLTTNIPCHNDLHGGNLIFLGNEFKAVDYEDAGQGDPYFDVATVASYFYSDSDHEKVLIETYLGRQPSAAENAKFYLMKQVILLKWAFGWLKRVPAETIRKYGLIAAPTFIDFVKEIRSIDLSKPENGLLLLKTFFSQVLDNVESQEFKDAVDVLRGLDIK